ncbi:Transmembrane protein 208 [Geodia barretti]|uniref:Transmembrane protein 208 n=1 Tax=Geodia barretti TaxID=519541 RepID=A0AA35QW12_GEOBA|nr:Transmembrane protein 208 [Geodia barretti]
MHAASCPFVRAQFFALFGPAVHGLCRWVLVQLARPHLGPSGELLEAGADLSDNYISEYVIDFVILTAFLQGLSFLSNLVWLLWLLVPGLVVYKVWRLLIWPWVSRGSPTAVDKDGSGSGGKRQKNKVKYMRR